MPRFSSLLCLQLSKTLGYNFYFDKWAKNFFQLRTSSMTSKLTGEGDEEAEAVPKKNIAILGYKQRPLSIEMKTKVVQHVESECMRD